MGNSDYSIIDWAYDGVDSFDSEESVESQIDAKAENSRDGGEAWRRFKSSVPDWINHPSKNGITLKDFIEEREEEVEEEKLEKEQEETADSIISQINKADTLSEIDRIDIDIDDSDARARAVSEWNDRRFEIQERIEEETGEFPT